ncbi:hypothetical protein AT746_08210 [Lacimicrobium alkaliphilum]|uniref:Uncharacterized protein n=1 Tax=Lacimicrobium alkaliphilum TaxID=1526571 RepID=A0A0U2ZGU7_9ALTE|nr:hypothetical protein AT746_08210 [Lacimicrobium alkaliphilum]
MYDSFGNAFEGLTFFCGDFPCFCAEDFLVLFFVPWLPGMRQSKEGAFAHLRICADSATGNVFKATKYSTL